MHIAHPRHTLLTISPWPHRYRPWCTVFRSIQQPTDSHRDPRGLRRNFEPRASFGVLSPRLTKRVTSWRSHLGPFGRQRINFAGPMRQCVRLAGLEPGRTIGLGPTLAGRRPGGATSVVSAGARRESSARRAASATLVCELASANP